MAPVYLATHVPNASAAPPLFALKGIKNMAPAALGSLALTGVPHFREVAYDAYKANIDAFIAATMRGQRVFCVVDGYGPIESKGSVPIREPPVSFALSKSVSEDQENLFVTKLGEGATKEKVGKTTVFHAYKPSQDMLNSIIRLHNPNFNFGKDRVNPMGLKAARLLMGYIAEFCRVNTYPAQRLNIDEEYPLELVTGDYGGEYNMEYYAAVKEGEEGFETYKELLQRTSAYRLKKRLEAEATGIDVDMDEKEKERYQEEGDLNGAYKSSLHDAVLTAKPSPAPLGTNIITVGELPELPGIAFPYFDGLVVPDSGVLKSSLATFFLRLLGSNIDQVKATLIEIRRGVQSLATTKTGMALTHMLTGVKLCLETQSRLQLIVSAEEYQGFVLLGSGFSVFDGSRWIVPESNKALFKDVAFMDPHAKAVEELIDMIARLRVEGGYPATADLPGPANIANLEELAGILKQVDLKEKEDKEDVEKELSRILRQLNLRGKGYYALTPQNVLEALTLFFDTSLAVPLEVPTFIPSYNAPLSSRAFRVLSRFGPDAPSFWDTKGQEYPLRAAEKVSAADAKGKRKAEEKDVFGLMPKNFLIFPKPLLVAVNEFEMVLKKGSVRFNLAERAKHHRALCLKDPATIKKFWELLVGAMADLPASESKKRKKEPSGPVAVDFDNEFGDLLK